jgi:HAD superfamily hydrolase (TIGR01509 family)
MAESNQSKYKLLVLDYGGVYSHGYDLQTAFKIADELFGCVRPPTKTSPELTSLEDRFSSGLVTTQEYIDELATILDAPKKPTPAALQNRMLEAAKDPSPLMVDLVRDVRAKGVKVALLSDMCAFEIPIAEKLHRFDGFDLVMLSANERMSKKNNGYFNLLFEKLPYSPAESLFFDDSEYCIETANAIGMDSILVQGEEMSTPEGLSKVVHEKLFN